MRTLRVDPAGDEPLPPELRQGDDRVHGVEYPAQAPFEAALKALRPKHAVSC